MSKSLSDNKTVKNNYKHTEIKYSDIKQFSSAYSSVNRPRNYFTVKYCQFSQTKYQKLFSKLFSKQNIRSA